MGLFELIALVGVLVLLPPPALAQQADSQSVVSRLGKALCEKRIVVLGELPSHGEARAFHAKSQIVERLVTRCGFDAVLFEAPIYDFLGFQAAAAKGSVVPAQLDKAIGRFWLTRELASWRQWLFERALGENLVVGGLDDQVSVTSEYARASLPSMVANWSPSDRAANCESTVARHLFWRYDARQPFDTQEQLRLQRCARGAADSVKARTRRHPGNTDAIMLGNLAGYVDRQVGVSNAPDRDLAMYRNVLWYTERMPKGSKVIIWTATVHAARQQGDLPQQPLGARLATKWGQRLAVVGFTARSGETSMAGQPRKQLSEAPPGSLEAQATAGEVAWAYVNPPALRKMGRVPSRLLGRFTSANWSAYFDHVVVVREEIAPVFEARP